MAGRRDADKADDCPRLCRDHVDVEVIERVRERPLCVLGVLAQLDRVDVVPHSVNRRTIRGRGEP